MLFQGLKSEHHLIEKRGVIVQNTTLNVIFLTDKHEGEYHLSIRAPLFPLKNWESLTSPVNCNFTEEIRNATDTKLFKRFLANHFRTNSGREDPYSFGTLHPGSDPHISTSDLRKIRKENFENLEDSYKYLRNDQFAIYLREGSRVKLIDSDHIFSHDNSNFGFKCLSTRAKKSLHIDSGEIVAIFIVLRGSFRDVASKNQLLKTVRVQQFIKKTQLGTSQPINCETFGIVGLTSEWPLIKISCTPPKDILLPMKTVINLEFKNTLECKRFRIADIRFAYQKTEVSDESPKNRSKRQVGAALGIASLGYLGFEALEHFLTKSDDTHVNDLQHEVEHVNLRLSNDEQIVQQLEHTTELYMKSSTTILEKISDLYCRQDSVLTILNFNEFIYKMFDEYLFSINIVTNNIIGRLNKNRAEELSVSLCMAQNSHLKRQLSSDNIENLCENYFRSDDNYQLKSIDVLNVNLNDRKTPSVVFHLNIVIPTFEFYKNVVKSLISLPIPLFSHNNVYTFKSYENLPKLFGIFSELDDRKVALDQCKKYSDSIYCDINIINNVYTANNICLNNVLSNSKAGNCKYNVYNSFQNCHFVKTDEFLAISHIGEINYKYFNSDRKIVNIHKLETEDIKDLSINITLVHRTKGTLNIKCINSEFTYRNTQHKIEPIVLVKFENETTKFPELESTFDTARDILGRDKNLSGIISQLRNTESGELLQLHEMIKNSHVKIPFISRELSHRVYSYSIPTLTVLNTIVIFGYLISKIYYFFRLFKARLTRRIIYKKGAKDRIENVN